MYNILMKHNWGKNNRARVSVTAQTEFNLLFWSRVIGRWAVSLVRTRNPGWLQISIRITLDLEFIKKMLKLQSWPKCISLSEVALLMKAKSCILHLWLSWPLWGWKLFNEVAYCTGFDMQAKCFLLIIFLQFSKYEIGRPKAVWYI